MKRGEIWSVSGQGYAGKPRPAVIVQDNRFAATASVTVCPFTTNETEAELFRLLVLPSRSNGLRNASRLMVDKLTTIDRHDVGRVIGILGFDDLMRLDGAIMTFLGLSDSHPTA